MIEMLNHDGLQKGSKAEDEDVEDAEKDILLFVFDKGDHFA